MTSHPTQPQTYQKIYIGFPFCLENDPPTPDILHSILHENVMFPMVLTLTIIIGIIPATHTNSNVFLLSLHLTPPSYDFSYLCLFLIVCLLQECKLSKAILEGAMTVNFPEFMRDSVFSDWTRIPSPSQENIPKSRCTPKTKAFKLTKGHEMFLKNKYQIVTEFLISKSRGQKTIQYLHTAGGK